MSSKIEHVLQEFYPVGTTLLSLLPARDQIALKHSSKTLLNLVGSPDCPCLEVSFFDASGADKRCLNKIDLWGPGYFWEQERLPDIRRGPRLTDAEEQCVMLFNWKRFVAEYEVLRQVRYLGLERVANLCLDTTTVRDSAVRYLMGEMDQLHTLSLRYCYGICLSELAKTAKMLQPGKLRKLNIWNIFDLREMQYTVRNTLSQTDFLDDVTAIDELSTMFELDTTFCECMEGMSSCRPAQITERTCAMCHRSETVRECTRCVIARCCEGCMDYHCHDCNPWSPERRISTSNSGLAYEDQNVQRSDPQGISYWRSSSELNAIMVVTKECSTNFCEVGRNTHYYHADCIPRYEDMTRRCCICRKWQCPHDISSYRCSICERLYCAVCVEGNIARCGNCNRLACGEDLHMYSMMYRRGGYMSRFRKLCTPCKKTFEETERALAYNSIGPQKVLTISH